MKCLFGTMFCILAAALAATFWSEPEARNEVPVIYWVIDPAPARGEQIALFHRWLIRNGHGELHTLSTMGELERFRKRRWSPALVDAITSGNADGPKVWNPATSAADLPISVRAPVVELRLDSASNDLTKKVIQGVSGVGADIIEAYNGGQQMQYLASAGMLDDVTERAVELGFGPDQTYPALAPSMFYEGRQYAFPRNPAQTLFWVNKDTFAKYGQPLPPRRWTVEEFQRRGKAFVDAANPPGARRTVFFADSVPLTELRRSLGLSMFNETLTRCTLDDPRNAQAMALIYRWTYEDHILPSAADKAGFDTTGGWGGQNFQLFKAGNYALFGSGRWALMLFRKFGAMPLAVVELPHAGFPNSVLAGGQATVYRGSKHRAAAELFLAYYASEDYNMQIVRDGDALPPNPKYADTPEFLRPPDHTNEWGCHEVYAETARSIAIVQSFSPFVLPVVALRYDGQALDKVMNNRATPREAAAFAAARINEEMARNLKESARLRARYRDLCAVQEKIDRLREQGQEPPIEWIGNPFHRALYRRKHGDEQAD